jgi:hypothetical protein
LDHAEDGGVGSDAEGKGCDHGGSESGRTAQGSEGVAKVAPEVIEPDEALLVAIELAGAQRPSNVALRGVVGVFG